MKNVIPAPDGRTCACFWPIALMALSLLTVLGSNLIDAWQARRTGERLHARNVELLGQATAVESRLQALLTDLVQLGQTDPAAALVVTKYGIRFESPR